MLDERGSPKLEAFDIPGTLQMRRNIRPLSVRIEEQAFQKKQDVR